MTIPVACLPTPPGCTAFPAVGRYSESWTLHAVVVDGEQQTHRAVRGTNASHLNDYVAAAMAQGATVFCWMSEAAQERCPACGRVTSATALLPCTCREAA